MVGTRRYHVKHMDQASGEFNALYQVSWKKDVFVNEVLQRDEDGGVEWNLGLPRRLADIEALEFAQLSGMLSSYVLQEGGDSRVWRWEKGGVFSVESCYAAIHKGGIENFYHNSIWDTLIPTKISFFIWLVHHNSAPTQDILAKKGMIIVNRCYLCRSDGESVNHMLLHCPFTREIWTSFLVEFGISWAFQKEVKYVFAEGVTKCFSEKGSVLWRLLPFAVCWIVWRERNERCFNVNEKEIERLIIEVKAILFYWLSPVKKLGVLRFEGLLFRWGAIVRKM
ncbi:Reverse transcriptase zinc-binding domain [Macleaya cordata]|uniref:Reverse transcriptase zinc-binding domain n=1 Tax=Macleaya cordata TaxID=56857 RepID=A0A200R384_MACCD|nr:Reverse transcriptase zinc-binding domain [Macleaya cordata]